MAGTGQSRRLGNHLRRNRTAVGNAQIQKRNRVAHTAIRQFSDQKAGAMFQHNTLFLSDFFQISRNILTADPAEIKPLAAGKDRRRDFVNLCCSQDKQNVRRRFFHNF